MVAPAQSTESAPSPPPAHNPGYGLRREILSPMETLAQSVSTMAPSSTPAVTVPLVCALAGNGTWLAYLLATIAVLLVALCIANFARHSSSPGSLYVYAASVLPRWMGAVTPFGGVAFILGWIALGTNLAARRTGQAG